jgi:hypothetical protein
MRYFLLIAFWASLLYSCKEVTYTEPQPAGIPALKEIPPGLRGTFLTRDKATGELGDTLIIEAWGYKLKDHNDEHWLGKGVLSDSLVLKVYKDYYFANFKEGNQWVLRLIKQKSPGIFELMYIDLSDEGKKKQVLSKLSKKLKVTEIRRSDDIFYQIKPTPDQLMTLIKEGYFSSVELRERK